MGFEACYFYRKIHLRVAWIQQEPASASFPDPYAIDQIGAVIYPTQ